MKLNLILIFLIVWYGLSGFALGGNCIDPLDTFSKYDNSVSADKINDIASDYYVLSYTWAPLHCNKLNKKTKHPGNKDYLQCGSGRTFGYILHGFWPQGAMNGTGGYPRACEGDQKKIDRRILEKYLCMTPSLWLLQHEYEYHGTCMHDESLEDPETYFATAYDLHAKLILPEKMLRYNTENVQWFLKHNPHLIPGSIQYYSRGQEWQFCYDNSFNVIVCPSNTGVSVPEQPMDCKVKGNISSGSKKKFYFLPSHPNYQAVVITSSKGERCFETEATAIAAGWIKAP